MIGTYKLVAATNINTFNDLVNEYLAKGYKFIADHPTTITPHEDISGQGYQYSVAMLLESEQA